ncbi:MAG: TIGR00341 family protein [Candidatus Kapaibacterium sp.]
MTYLKGVLFNLHNGEEDKQKTLQTVTNNISFTGSNLWILAGAIFVASIGLNVNSTAVIIGAMLISPLMGPIVGSGFALAIYDFDLLKKSIINLFIATLVGLIVSTIYFYVSPFKEAQSELIARTSPNIYDVLIAFFGGLVGVIAITRVEKGNPIPGVAIATALMPPLCTAGFGLATGNFKFFFGALFLYAINCVFICISTFTIVKYLKYPSKKDADVKHQKRLKYGMTAIIVLMLLPSTYFAFSLYKQQQFKHGVETFIENEFIDKGYTIIFKKTKYSVSLGTIELAFLNKVFTSEEIHTLNSKLNNYGLHNTILTIKQNSTDNINALRDDILNEVTKKDRILEEKDKQIVDLKSELSKNTFDDKQIFSEVKIIFPSVLSIAVNNLTYFSSDTSYVKTVFIYQANPKLNDSDKNKLKIWMQKKLSISEIEVINQ